MREPELAQSEELGESYHSARSVADLTERNVKTIVALEREALRRSSAADRLAAAISRFCGSMLFFWLNFVWFVGWIAWNLIPGLPHPDPYPFGLLTLAVSLEAIFLSTFILISENRQERINERRSHLDLQINLLAEQENTKTLELLEKIARKLDIDTSGDPSVSVLEEATRPETLVAQIEASVSAADSVEKPAS